MRRFVPGAITALFVLAVGEFACWAVFTRLRDRLEFGDPGSYALPPDRVRGLDRRFDAELGWVTRYPTPHGERPREREYGRPLAVTYGDSHTFGDEVKDDETWQTYLSRALAADVYNFGVGGYGPDQALLRFRREGRPPAPWAIVGVGLENINRVVSRYRPFYFRQTGLTLPKPRFVLKDGRLELRANPLRSAADLPRLSDPAFLRELAADDLWAPRGEGPRLGFPYLRLLVSPAVWRQVTSPPRGNDDDARPERNLWKDDEARALFLAILDAFASDAQGAGMAPLILIQPALVQVEAVREGRGVPGHARVLEHCRTAGYACVDGIADLARGTERPLADYFRPGGHASPLGNARLADLLAPRLRPDGGR